MQGAPAEILFDQGLGDLFVIRVAGNIAAPARAVPGGCQVQAGHDAVRTPAGWLRGVRVRA
jgi:carbonic anhydrase